MARQPTFEELGGSPNVAGARPVGGYDVASYARGAQQIAQAGAHFGQAVESVGAALPLIAAKRDQTQYVNAISRGITKGLNLHAQLRANPDYDSIVPMWQDGTRQIIEDEAATINNPVLRDGLRAKLGADFAQQHALIADQAFQARAAASLAHIAQDRQDLVEATGADADPLHNSKIVAHNALIDTAENNRYLSRDAAREEKRRSANAVAVAQYANMGRVDPERAVRELSSPGDGNVVLSALSPDQRNALLDHATRQQQARAADAVIAAHRKAQQLRQASDQAEHDIIDNLFSAHPTVTADDIANNPQLNHDARVNMLALADRTAQPDPTGTSSNITARILLDRIRMPDGDPAKIVSPAPIYAAYVRHQIGKDDFLFVRRELLQSSTSEGENLLARKQAFLRSIDHTIDRSDPLTGNVDDSGRLQMYRLERDLDRKIDEYRKAAKNPLDLFDPSKSDYVGKPESLLSYRTSLDQQAEDAARHAATTSANTAGSPSALAGAVPKRLPGETPAEYLKRVPQSQPDPRPRPPISR